MPENSKKQKERTEITSRDIEFMRQACLLCDNSTLDVRTGCLLVKDGIIIGSGWNLDTHAEIMAINEALLKDADLGGVVGYVTRFPCEDCARELIENGVSKLFYMSDHFSSGNAALSIFKEAGIVVVQILEEAIWD